MRDGLSRGLLETILALAGTALVIGGSIAPSVVEDGLASGMALIGASATSYGLRYTKDKPPEEPVHEVRQELT